MKSNVKCVIPGKGISILTACLLMIIFYGCDKDDNEGSAVNGTDINFIVQASVSNYGEALLGQLAADSSETQAIISYGQMMVSDHSQANADLMNIAGSAAHAADSLNLDHKALRSELLTLSGRAFDSVYIHHQIMDHIHTISLFLDEINGGKNIGLKDYAVAILPKLQAHLQAAREIADGY